MNPRLERILNHVITIFGLARNRQNDPARWFLAFKSLLSFQRMTYKVKKDFHVMSFVDEYPDGYLERAFAQYCYDRKKHVKVDGVHVYDRFDAQKLVGVDELSVHVHYLYKAGSFFYGYLPKEPEYTFTRIPKVHIGSIEKVLWPEAKREINIPVLKGGLLEVWYPLWFVPDNKFKDVCKKCKVTVKSIKKLS